MTGARSKLAKGPLVRDAKNRAARAGLQAGAALALLSVVEAVVAWAAGGAFDVRLVVGGAVVAGLQPVASALHRLVLDPSGLPSALPPSEPGQRPKSRARRPRQALP